METEMQKPLQPPLDEYQRQLDALSDDARQLTEGLSREQLNWSEPGRWSIAQCLEHVSRVDRAYAKRLERGIDQAREKGLLGSGRVSYGFLERWFMRAMEPPPRRRFNAPKAVVPAEDHAPDDVMANFLATRDRLIELLRRSEGVDIARAKITSPLSKLLKLRVGAAFAILAAHGRRHLWQARQVRQQAGFPKA